MEGLGDFLRVLFFSLLVLLVVFVFVRWLRYRKRRRPLSRELAGFLGQDPFELPIVSHTFATVDLPNLQFAMDDQRKRSANSLLIGYISHSGGFRESLRDLFSNQAGPFMGTHVGPVKYRQVDIDTNRQAQCVENGIHLLERGEGRVAAHQDPLRRQSHFNPQTLRDLATGKGAQRHDGTLRSEGPGITSDPNSLHSTRPNDPIARNSLACVLSGPFRATLAVRAQVVKIVSMTWSSSALVFARSGGELFCVEDLETITSQFE